MDTTFKRKNGFVLLEVIFSIVLFSLIALGTIEFLFSLRESNIETTKIVTNSIKLEATRLFLSHNNNFSQLVFANNSLYFNADILLDKVSSYELQIVGEIATIDICINQNSICQTWKIKV